MYKILIAFMTLQMIVTISGSSFGYVFVNVDNEADIIEAAKTLSGVTNLDKKMKIPQTYRGIENMREKAMPIEKLMKSYEDDHKPQTYIGNENMREKAMPIKKLMQSYEDDHKPQIYIGNENMREKAMPIEKLMQSYEDDHKSQTYMENENMREKIFR